MLPELELPERSSWIGRGRFFPTLWGRHQTTTLQTRIHLTCWKNDNLVHRVCSRGRACLSLLPSLFSAMRDFHCVERKKCVVGLATESSCRCFCVSSWRSRSVLPKSASVVARDSALMVTVFTCSSSASVFSRVSLMAPLKSSRRLSTFASRGASPLLAVLVLE